MLEYKVDNFTFALSYSELREGYLRVVAYDDQEFMKNLPEALHLACIICFLKEIPTYVSLSDKGIIHEVAHLFHIPDGNTTTLGEIRGLFREQLKLV